jgi:sister chromatid cohesion protein PDS5
MAPSKRRSTRTQPSSDPAPSSDPIDEPTNSLPPLQFRQAISWTAGKPIAEGELIKRLEALYKEISQKEQEDINVESLRSKASDLVSERLLKHRNRGVQAWAACCIVEMLRLFAPDAPYTPKEMKVSYYTLLLSISIQYLTSSLKNIFLLVIEHIIPSLADSSSTYHAQHLAVIRSLKELQSILLIQDANSSTALMTALFTVCFDVLSGPSKSSELEVSINVAHNLSALLIELSTETDNLPDEVIDIVMAQFLRADPRTLSNMSNTKGKKGTIQIDEKQATLLLKDAPAAYTMAQDLCNVVSDKMARYVLRYFSSVLLDTSMAISSEPKKGRRKTQEEEEEEDITQGPSEEELKESKKAHLLLRELWRAAPSVLREIIPQLESELSTENTHIRLMAVEAIGDMIAGIGAAGPPQVTPLDPSAYPSQSLQEDSDRRAYHFLLTPTTSVAFISRYHSTYQAFMGRRNDKSGLIRAAWSTAVGRILQTSAGGVGLEAEEENKLLEHFAVSLVDSDEKVRHSAVKAIEQFSFQTVVSTIGKDGGLSKENTVLSNLADRAKDRKPNLRADAIQLLGRLWGVAAGAIAEGNEHITEILGGIPTKLIGNYYINDAEIHKAVDRVVFESFIPLSYPPKVRQQVSQDSQKSIKNGDSVDDNTDPDKIRVERILLLISSLDQRCRAVFFTKQRNQVTLSRLMVAYLSMCEEYNGGVIEPQAGRTEKEVESQLSKLAAAFAQPLPDKQRAIDDLKKFAKQHDRRCYALIRFCCDTNSDWAKVRKSVKELSKRIEETTPSSSVPSTILDTLLTLLYRSSILVFNKSNVPAIIHYSRTDEKGLGSAAHEMLKEISKTHGDIFSSHVVELCKTLAQDAPTANKPHRINAVEDLKACAEFSQKFPEKMPQDRKFFNSLLSYMKYGQPRAAKYAVRILLTTAAKKPMYSQEVFEECSTDFKFGEDRFLSKLAALSQLVLYGAAYLESDKADSISDIAITEVLTNTKASPGVDQKTDTDDWTDEPDDNIMAKTWAMKILVNRLRGYSADADISKPTELVFKFLNGLINKMGQIQVKNPGAKSHASRLRLLAGTSLLKLAREPRFNEKIGPIMFNQLVLMTQDIVFEVRSSFVHKLIKYLGQIKLAKRFYTPLFLLAFEPVADLKTSTETWIRSRATAFARDKDTTLELVLPRLLSLLAHHPDFENTAQGLTEMASYIVYYLRPVATRENISLIFHVAQRVKAIADGIDKQSTHIYVLSDLAQALIRRWDERHDWNMHTWPAKVNLPAGIFTQIDNAERAREIAGKIFLPADVLDSLDAIVAEGLKPGKTRKGAGSKSKGENASGKSRKRGHPTTGEAKKVGTPNAKKARTTKISDSASKRKSRALSSEAQSPSSERRRSGRNTRSFNYKEDETDGPDGAADKDTVPSKVNGSVAKGRRGRGKAIENSSDVEMDNADDE